MRDEKLAKVMKEFYIPDYIVVPEESNSSSGSGTSDDEDDAPSCPVIVFINSKSGGQLGSRLLITYRSLLNQNQVIVIVILIVIVIVCFFCFLTVNSEIRNVCLFGCRLLIWERKSLIRCCIKFMQGCTN